MHIPEMKILGSVQSKTGEMASGRKISRKIQWLSRSLHMSHMVWSYYDNIENNVAMETTTVKAIDDTSRKTQYEMCGHSVK